MNIKLKIKKVYRYISIYGIFRTLVKVFGRMRLKIPVWIFLSFPNYIKNGKTVGFIVCGHQKYASLAFYLTTCAKNILSFILEPIKTINSKNTFHRIMFIKCF